MILKIEPVAGMLSPALSNESTSMATKESSEIESSFKYRSMILYSSSVKNALSFVFSLIACIFSSSSSTSAWISSSLFCFAVISLFLAEISWFTLFRSLWLFIPWAIAWIVVAWIFSRLFSSPSSVVIAACSVSSWAVFNASSTVRLK